MYKSETTWNQWRGSQDVFMGGGGGGGQPVWGGTEIYIITT